MGRITVKELHNKKRSYTEVFSYFLSKRVKTEHWNELKDLMSCQALRQLFEKIIEEVPDEGCGVPPGW